MPKTTHQIGPSSHSVKLCLRCRETKEVSQFYKDKSRPDGFNNSCIPCRREIKGIIKRRAEAKAARERREAERKEQIAIRRKQRDAIKRQHEKDMVDLHGKDWKLVLQRKRVSEWQKNNRDKVNAKQKRWRNNNPDKIKEARKRWREDNKDKVNKSKAKYREENRERINEYARAWRIKNKEKIKERERLTRSKPEYKAKAKEYYEANRDLCLSRTKEWLRNHRKTPMGAMQNRLRVRLWSALNKKGYTKRSRTNDIIGCSWNMLVKHIEKQFTKGMSWDNRGDWHVDHIIPLSSASDEDELIKLSHFSNLRPMWADENMAKRDRIIDCQPELLLKH